MSTRSSVRRCRRHRSIPTATRWARSTSTAAPADEFDAADVQRLHVYGVHAGHALAMAHMVTTLQEGIESRHEIGLAQGILMSRYDMDRNQAFESLRRYSSHANVKLREVAALVIDTGQLPASYDVGDAKRMTARGG